MPSTIYGSFLTGSSFVVIDGPSNGFDDVDAITHQPAPDSDGDGIPDTADNCTLEHNPNQIDADGDGIGNICDEDLDNDCSISFSDIGVLKSVFFTNDPKADINVDGVVNFLDLGELKDAFFGTPGPAATPNLCAP